MLAAVFHAGLRETVLPFDQELAMRARAVDRSFEMGAKARAV
jgi:hypothetical protein